MAALTVIRVTAEHIREGRKVNVSKCPVALALKSATGKVYHAGSTFCTRVGGGPRMHDFPAKVTKFIKAFDHSEPVEPFTFEIDLGDHYNEDA